MLCQLIVVHVPIIFIILFLNVNPHCSLLSMNFLFFQSHSLHNFYVCMLLFLGKCFFATFTKLFDSDLLGGDFTNRRKEIEYPNRGVETDPTHHVTAGPIDPNSGPDGNGVLIMDTKNENRPASFFAQPGILAGKSQSSQLLTNHLTHHKIFSF